MRVHCPCCNERVVQAKNLDGPNFCPACRKLFYAPEEPKMPPWIMGILVILAANWQLMNQ